MVPSALGVLVSSGGFGSALVGAVEYGIGDVWVFTLLLLVFFCLMVSALMVLSLAL